jgi:hypothetical protein
VPRHPGHAARSSPHDLRIVFFVHVAGGDPIVEGSARRISVAATEIAVDPAALVALDLRTMRKYLQEVKL